MIKILQVHASTQYSGVSSILIDIFKNINKEKFNFDFLIFNEKTLENVEPIIKKFGGKIYKIPLIKESKTYNLKLFIKCIKFFNNCKYDIVHINSGCVSFDFFVSLAAKVSKNKTKIIVHSHSAPIVNSKIKQIFRNFIKKIMNFIIDGRIACSKISAFSTFPKDIVNNDGVYIINNGIDFKKFKPTKKLREKTMSKLNITNKFVVGHIGRFSKEKNHKFLIDIFNEITIKKENSILILIGEGPLLEETKKYVSKLNLSEKVFFLGLRSDVNSLLSIMDAFVMPSIHEGFGTAALEAQACHIRTFVSDNLSSEIIISNKVNFLSLSLSAKEWAGKILEKKYNEKFQYTGNYQKYDIKYVTKKIEQIYLEIL